MNEELRRVESQIGDCLNTLNEYRSEVAERLRIIKEKELWRKGDYQSFEDFLSKQFGITEWRDQ